MWLFMESINYRNPTAAYLMLGIPLIGFLFWWLQRHREEVLKRLCGGVLGEMLTKRRSTLLMLFKTLLFSLSWMLATLALMDPYEMRGGPDQESQGHLSQRNLPRKRKAQDVILLMDVSASMTITDGPAGSTRLDFAKQIADDIVARLRGQSVALTAFTSELVSEVPPTWDYLYTRLMIRSLNINASDTAGTDFLQVLKELRAQHWVHKDHRTMTLVIFSDGEDTELETLEGATKATRFNEIVNMVAGADHLQVLTVAMGSAEGGDVPNITFNDQPVHSRRHTELLEALSQGHGDSYLANDFTSLDLSKRIENLIERHTQYEVVETTSGQRKSAEEPRSLYQIPLAFALLALLGAILLPERER